MEQCCAARGFPQEGERSTDLLADRQKILYKNTVLRDTFRSPEKLSSRENPVSEAAHLVQYIVVPYRAAANGVAPGEIRPASSEFGAIRIANSMASKFAGVAAYEVLIDKETGDMESPRILAQIGTVPSLDD